MTGPERRVEKRRAVCLAAVGWAGLAAAYTLLVPGGAAEVPEGLSAILRSCLWLPIAEELIFRGALLSILQPLGRNAALLGQAVLFAAVHGTPVQKGYAFGMGLLFGWAAQVTGSPVPGMVLHILNNGLVLARALAERGA